MNIWALITGIALVASGFYMLYYAPESGTYCTAIITALFLMGVGSVLMLVGVGELK